VASIYQSNDAAEVFRLMDKYKVKYIYVGRRERAAYGAFKMTDFAGFMKTAFASAGVVIYQKEEISPQSYSN
jgi:uncharacterized membrane protein